MVMHYLVSILSVEHSFFFPFILKRQKLKIAVNFVRCGARKVKYYIFTNILDIVLLSYLLCIKHNYSSS